MRGSLGSTSLGVFVLGANGAAAPSGFNPAWTTLNVVLQ